MLNNILRNNGERLTPTFKEEFKITSDITNNKKTCRCGHTQFVPKRHTTEFDLCSWCDGRLYSDDKKQQLYEKKRNKEEFLFHMRKVLGHDSKEAIF